MGNPEPPEPDNAGCGDDSLREPLIDGDDAETPYEEMDVSP